MILGNSQETIKNRIEIKVIFCQEPSPCSTTFLVVEMQHEFHNFKTSCSNIYKNWFGIIGLACLTIFEVMMDCPRATYDLFLKFWRPDSHGQIIAFLVFGNWLSIRPFVMSHCHVAVIYAISTPFSGVYFRFPSKNTHWGNQFLLMT